jgi:ribonuclease E
MPKRILVDAVHPEQTRVVILKDGRVQEFYSETSFKTQLKGNIYLAKVTRVEPSLQAAFVEYGGGKHGFLPFAEINPDYYHVPVSDKEELKRALREVQSEDSGYDDIDDEVSSVEESEDEDSFVEEISSGDDIGNLGDENSAAESSQNRFRYRRARGQDRRNNSQDSSVDLEEEGNSRIKKIMAQFLRKYRIQEVIKRGQVLLVQVIKEERGNKGASLSTYITLPGRYCVLMPNTPRQGGVSRRIGSSEDRRRLKTLLEEFSLPDEASIIIRTAGAGKSMSEIRRDYDYLAKIWNNIRTQTLSSSAPAFIYGEGNVVEKALRDLYDDEVDEVLVEGEESFNKAKEFMSHALIEHRNSLKIYRSKVPVFTRYRVEEQIEALYHHVAPLESGGYVVINPTEALISIDVNSGRATNQRSIEETAIKTNTEAAYEIARQLRLRELSGLVVIDFIDMLELKNRISIEQSLRDAFQGDRARVQIGRISPFGLLEMSRQRLGPSFYETNTVKCPHCQATGAIRATETIGLTVLRQIETHINRHGRPAIWDVTTSLQAASYVLNYKRADLQSLEQRYQSQIYINVDERSDLSNFAISARNENGASVSERSENTDDKSEAEAALGAVDENSNNKDRRNRSRRRRGRSGEGNAAAVNDSERDEEGVSGVLKGLWRRIVE